MSELQKYKNKRMKRNPGFWKDYNERFETFKLDNLAKSLFNTTEDTESTEKYI